MLLGNNNNEAGLFDLISMAGGGNVTAKSTASENLGFTCPAGTVAAARAKAGIPTWRYRYFGVWPNNQLTPTSGAWHGSEIGPLFGTTAIVSGEQPIPAEIELGEKMRHAWASFAKDPYNGLKRPEIAWPTYDPEKPTLVRLGYENSPIIDFVDPNEYDNAQPYSCSWWKDTENSNVFGGSEKAATPDSTVEEQPAPALVNVAPALPLASEEVSPFASPAKNEMSFPFGIRPGVSGEDGRGRDTALPIVPRVPHSPPEDGFDRKSAMANKYDPHPHGSWQGFPRDRIFPDVLDGEKLESGGAE
jgi:Carboxylesterase family